MHGYRGAVTDEFQTNMRGTAFKWMALIVSLIFLFFQCSSGIMTLVGPWFGDNIPKLLDVSFSIRDRYGVDPRDTRGYSDAYTPTNVTGSSPPPPPAAPHS
jgi:hypothetical protein